MIHWLPLSKFPDFYDISDEGEIMFKERVVIDMGGKRSRVFPEKMMTLVESKYGYWAVNLWVNNKNHPFLVHRLVLETFVGLRPKGMQCRHLDGNRKNNKLSNLCWGTQKENEQDKLRHGTLLIGEKHGCAKISDKDTIEIRRLRKTRGLMHKELAAMFGVSRSMITMILNGRRRGLVK